MMKVQTLARRAEDQVMSELLKDRRIIKPWSLASHDMQTVTLQTTLDEVPLLFLNPAHLRPGFKVDERTVQLPGLFVKLSGTDMRFSLFDDVSSLEKRENCFMVLSFSKFSPAVTDTVPFLGEFLTPDFRVNRERLLSMGQMAVCQLRLEYQQLFMDKMDEILMHREEYLLLSAKALSCEEVLLAMLSLNHAYIEAWNNFDFQYLPPALVLHNEGRESLSPSQAVQLLLLRLLGFDIIIISKTGVSDLENVIHNEVYNLFYGERQAAGAKKRGKINKFIPIAILSIFVGLVAAVFLFIGNESPNLKPVVTGVRKVWDIYLGSLDIKNKAYFSNILLSKKQTNKVTYNNLLIVFPNTDAEFKKNGAASHYKGTMERGLKVTAVDAFKNLSRLVPEGSNGIVEFKYDIIEIQDPITSITVMAGGQYSVGPEDISEVLTKYAPKDKYDSVHVLWNNGPIDSSWVFGGTLINNDTSTYSCLIPCFLDAWTGLGECFGEPFLFGWLQGVCRFYQLHGAVMPDYDVLGGSRHGYVKSSTDGNFTYYKDLMQGKVWEPRLGDFTGITRQDWLSRTPTDASPSPDPD